MALSLAARRGVEVDVILPRALQPSASPTSPATGRCATWRRRVRPLVHAVHAPRQGGRHRRAARARRLRQPRPAQPLPQLRADGRVLRARPTSYRFAAWIEREREAPSRRGFRTGRARPASAISRRVSCSGWRSSSSAEGAAAASTPLDAGLPQGEHGRLPSGQPVRRLVPAQHGVARQDTRRDDVLVVERPPPTGEVARQQG